MQRLLPLINFMRDVRPNQIIWWPLSEKTSEDEFFLLGGQGGILDLLLKTGYWDAEFECKCIPHGPLENHREIPSKRRRWRKRLGDWVNRNRAFGLRFALKSQLGPNLNHQHPLLVMHTQSGMLRFVQYAHQHHRVGVDCWVSWREEPVNLDTSRTIPTRQRTESIPEQTVSLEHLRTEIQAGMPEGFLEISGCGQASYLLASALSRFVTGRIFDLQELYQRMWTYIGRRRPLAILAGNAFSDAVQAMAQAARNRQVPMVVFQQGGAYGYWVQPYLGFTDLQVGDIFSAFGPGVKTGLVPLAEALEEKVTFVASGWPEGLNLARKKDGSIRNRLGLNSEPPAAMYVPTGLMGDFNYGPYHNLEDTRYFHLQTEVVKALACMDRLQVIVKLHYKDAVANPLKMVIEDECFDTVSVMQQEPLNRVISLADVIVVDFPSTAFLEALASGLPVVVIDNEAPRYHPHAMGLLRSSAIWVEKGEGWQGRLQEAVLRALEQGGIAPEKNLFLREFANLDYRPELLWQELQNYKAA